MSGLPSGWASVPLDEVFEPRSTRVSPGDFPDLPYIGLEQVEAQTGKLLGTVPASSMSSSAAVFRAGDVLYGRMRPYLNKVLQPQFDGLASAEFIVFPALRGIDNRFIRSRLSAGDFVEFACSQYEGDRPRVKFDQLGKFQLALPPAAEQTRIVAKLEELLSDLDAGVAELKAAQKKLTQYRQSLLKAAVEGALTAAWRKQHPPAETGAQLLQRILAERRARWEARQLARFKEQGKAPPKDWQKKYPEPVQPDTSGLPELPQGWVWACLGQLLAELTSGSRDWAPFYNRGASVFVMAQNVRPWRPDFEFKQYVDPPIGHRDRARSEIRVDDLLTTIVGANTGQVCRVAEPIESHFVCQSVALMRLVIPSMSEYVNAVLNSEGHGQRQFREMNYGAGRPHLSFDQLESVFVPLPPLNEQAQVVEVVADALQSLERTDAQTETMLKQSNAQRQNILRAAFAGQLVPQDPADEPASVLLERIRAERVAATQAKPTRKGRGRFAEELT